MGELSKKSVKSAIPSAHRRNACELNFCIGLLRSIKLKKSERELLAFLELHPGPHNVAELKGSVKNASQAARGLARRELIRLEPEGMRAPSGFERPMPILNAHQQEAL